MRCYFGVVIPKVEKLLFGFAGEQQEGEAGGVSLEIDHDMHLCSDPAIGRSGEGFNGRLLELAIWDEALSPETVAFFYQQV